MPRINLEDLGEIEVPEPLLPYVNVRADEDNCFEWGVFVKPEIKEGVAKVGRYLLKTLGEGEAYEKAGDQLATSMLEVMLPPLGELQAKMEVVLADFLADLKVRFPQAFEEECDGGQ